MVQTRDGISFRIWKKTENDDKTEYDPFYLHSKAETIVNETDIDDDYDDDDNVFKSIYTTITLNIHSVFLLIDHNANISK